MYACGAKQYQMFLCSLQLARLQTDPFVSQILLKSCSDLKLHNDPKPRPTTKTAIAHQISNSKESKHPA